jgi:hypothetical protein
VHSSGPALRDLRREFGRGSSVSAEKLQSLLSGLAALFGEEPTPSPPDERVRECLLTSSLPSNLAALFGLLPSRSATDLARAHENGFFRFDLYEPRNRVFRLRLHLWTELSQALASDVHNHTRDYWSVVLLGRLKVTQFEQARGHQFFHYVASNESANGAYSFSFASKLSLRKVLSTDLWPGEVHSEPYQQLHKVAPLVVPTATLFLQGPERSVVTDVFSLTPKPPISVERPLTSSDRDLILCILDSLLATPQAPPARDREQQQSSSPK